MSYEIISHGKNMGLRIISEGEEDLFYSALEGLNKIINPVSKNSETDLEKEISIEALDLGNLLVEFLNEAISLSYLNKEVYFFKNIRISRNDEYILEVGLSAKKAKSFSKKIKEASYDNLYVKQMPDGKIEANVVFII
jgi:SHS2 domain-containing protein